MIRGGAWFIYVVMKIVFLLKFSTFSAILPIFRYSEEAQTARNSSFIIK